ncbi:MAG: response regulator transcription factor [Clostridiales bacterium]|nr:response regulator transcription factor [Clostridiales bacterium]MCF8023046.1 response regulator transcription factor [Clostridiales bacterium]
MNKKKINVLVADDHVLIREGLTRILSLDSSIVLAGEAENGEQCVKIVTENKVDVVLMDVSMPGLNGIEASKIIKEKSPDTNIIALTIHEDDEYIFEMIRSGISAYLLKDVSSNELIQTIKGTARGESFIPPRLMARVFQEFNRLSSTPPDQSSGLTRREMEILQLVAQGDNNRSISEKLFISEKTVKNHLTNIFEKLDVGDRTQAALYAIKNKIVDA